VKVDADALIKAARQTREFSYSPYSRFAVGAAVLTQDGDIYQGSNVENASYGLAMCAERVAIFKAITSGAKRLKAVAIVCPSLTSREPASQMPCGACLQVMAEFASDDLEVIVDGVGRFNLHDLLSRPFKLASRARSAQSPG
jgi:cytidine deaminase